MMINTLKIMMKLRRPKNLILGYTKKSGRYVDASLLDILDKLSKARPKGYVFGETKSGLVSTLNNRDHPEEVYNLKKGYFRKKKLYYEVYKNRENHKIYYIDVEYFRGRESLGIKLKSFDYPLV